VSIAILSRFKPGGGVSVNRVSCGVPVIGAEYPASRVGDRAKPNHLCDFPQPNHPQGPPLGMERYPVQNSFVKVKVVQ
jgi:hypothetical protein